VSKRPAIWRWQKTRNSAVTQKVLNTLNGHERRRTAAAITTSGQSNLTQGRMIASPPLHSAHPSPETKQHLDLFSHFCTADQRVSSGMPGHVLAAKNCSFAWADPI